MAFLLLISLYHNFLFFFLFLFFKILFSEEKFLNQIFVEEQFGPVQKLGEEEKKKMLASKKAAIGFTYDDSTPSSSAAASTSHNIPVVPQEALEEDESDSDIDLGNYKKK